VLVLRNFFMTQKKITQLIAIKTRTSGVTIPARIKDPMMMKAKSKKRPNISGNL
jgi:hypothetical protein